VFLRRLISEKKKNPDGSQKAVGRAAGCRGNPCFASCQAFLSNDKNAEFVTQTNFLSEYGLQTVHPLFSLMSASGKEKSSQKRNRVWGVSPVATGEEGSAPSTAPPFEKGGRKPFAAGAS